MATQTFDDGSYSIFENAKGDSSKFNLIVESLKALTEPEMVAQMTEKLVNKGILEAADVENLIVEGAITTKGIGKLVECDVLNIVNIESLLEKGAIDSNDIASLLSDGIITEDFITELQYEGKLELSEEEMKEYIENHPRETDGQEQENDEHNQGDDEQEL